MGAAKLKAEARASSEEAVARSAVGNGHIGRHIEKWELRWKHRIMGQLMMGAQHTISMGNG
jgi:hypothetical protein